MRINVNVDEVGKTTGLTGDQDKQANERYYLEAERQTIPKATSLQ